MGKAVGKPLSGGQTAKRWANRWDVCRRCHGAVGKPLVDDRWVFTSGGVSPAPARHAPMAAASFELVGHVPVVLLALLAAPLLQAGCHPLLFLLHTLGWRQHLNLGKTCLLRY